MANRFEGWERWATLVLQVVLGLIFMAHGAQKLFGMFGGAGITGLAGYFTKIGISPGLFWAWVVGLVEFFGGLALIAGLLTRLAGFGLAVNMLGALFLVHIGAGFFLPNGYEFVLALLGSSVTLTVTGAGRYAVDTLLAQRAANAASGVRPLRRAA